MSLAPYCFQDKSTRPFVIAFPLTFLDSLLLISSCVEPPAITNILLSPQRHHCFPSRCAFAQRVSLIGSTTLSLPTSSLENFFSKTPLQCLLLLKTCRVHWEELVQASSGCIWCSEHCLLLYLLVTIHILAPLTGPLIHYYLPSLWKM